MEDLKLIALDPEDLRVLSCHLQDAVFRVGDMAYLKPEMRFAAIVNRFDWERAGEEGSDTYERRRSGVRFERVKAARVQGLDLQQKDQVLALLALTFDAGDEPSGAITLHFAGGAAVRLEVECIEAELRDLGAAWRARSRPVHTIDD
ncbi:MAG: DUF2948 family protein [Hyphomicrobium sp.]|jgi:hypothetical protein